MLEFFVVFVFHESRHYSTIMEGSRCLGVSTRATDAKFNWRAFQPKTLKRFVVNMAVRRRAFRLQAASTCQLREKSRLVPTEVSEALLDTLLGSCLGVSCCGGLFGYHNGEQSMVSKAWWANTQKCTIHTIRYYSQLLTEEGIWLEFSFSHDSYSTHPVHTCPVRLLLGVAVSDNQSIDTVVHRQATNSPAYGWHLPWKNRSMDCLKWAVNSIK